MIKKVIILPDVHLTEDCPKDYLPVKKFIKQFKPDEVILLGDFMDVSSLSAWDYDKKRLMEGKRFKKELNRANKELDFLQQHSKKITYLAGNHPYHKNTEVLTKNGWINISDKNLLLMDVAQFSIESRGITYSKPITQQSVYTKKVITFENNYTKQVVNPEHKVVYNGEKINADLLIGKELDKNKFIYNGYNILNSSIDLSADELRLITWIIMDGSLVFRDDRPHHIQFKLSKERKIHSLTELLNSMSVKYTIQKASMSGINKLQPYMIRIYKDSKKYFKLLNNKKQFPSRFVDLSSEQLREVLKTITITDGSKAYSHYNWTTTSKIDLDIIMQASITNNIYFKYTKGFNHSGFKNGKLQYRASFYLDDLTKSSLQKIKISVSDYNDFCYCLTMPQGTLITRIDGKIAFSGNCDRVSRYLDKNPEMEGLIEIETNLNLKGRKIKFIKMNDLYKVGDMYFTHGMYTNLHNARKHLQTLGCNICYGHQHSTQTAMQNMAMQKPYMAYALGTLGDKKPDYLRNKPGNWINQFGIFYYNDKNGNFNLYPVNVIKGKFIWNGKVYGG